MKYCSTSMNALRSLFNWRSTGTSSPSPRSFEEHICIHRRRITKSNSCHGDKPYTCPHRRNSKPESPRHPCPVRACSPSPRQTIPPCVTNRSGRKKREKYLTDRLEKLASTIQDTTDAFLKQQATLLKEVEHTRTICVLSDEDDIETWTKRNGEANRDTVTQTEPQNATAPAGKPHTISQHHPNPSPFGGQHQLPHTIIPKTPSTHPGGAPNADGTSSYPPSRVRAQRTRSVETLPDAPFLPMDSFLRPKDRRDDEVNDDDDDDD
ncbi:hypothetical protein GQ43DRAFT_110773 [Delitschia confertaspora ATCC 74209]|uniref:Uncharacterized protein n=1 Tax=Delitschia confertaspora ATCC 74209 TaxID=1513339 RepID=A0A9P4JK52_9PLEO|nr:hypothetical protein GQ43DRAFT_110773 [Delitschia confertaspora ATCC 74209]